MRAVARLSDTVRGRRQAVVRDPLHVIAGVDDDRAVGRLQAHPLPGFVIPHLETFGPRCRQDREKIDILMTEQAAGA